MSDQVPPATPDQSASKGDQASQLDIEKLADKVYRLMLEDLRRQRSFSRTPLPPKRR